MFAERRRKRSNFAGLALQYWLTTIARQKGVFGIVVADSAGLLVASSLKGPVAEELAAIAPLMDRSTGQPTVRTKLAKVPIMIHRVMIDRSLLYVCAIGEGNRSEDSVRLACGGVKRILTTH